MLFAIRVISPRLNWRTVIPFPGQQESVGQDRRVIHRRVTGVLPSPSDSLFLLAPSTCTLKPTSNRNAQHPPIHQTLPEAEAQVPDPATSSRHCKPTRARGDHDPAEIINAKDDKDDMSHGSSRPVLLRFNPGVARWPVDPSPVRWLAGWSTKAEEKRKHIGGKACAWLVTQRVLANRPTCRVSVCRE